VDSPAVNLLQSHLVFFLISELIVAVGKDVVQLLMISLDSAAGAISVILILREGMLVAI
jgi:hypothetical protein